MREPILLTLILDFWFIFTLILVSEAEPGYIHGPLKGTCFSPTVASSSGTLLCMLQLGVYLN